MSFTFHVLGVPHTKTHLDYVACAFTQKAYKFCKMMTDRGHKVIHYGVEGSNPECTENVDVLSHEIWEKVYGEHQHEKKFFSYDCNDEAYQTFYKNAIEEIKKRRYRHDFLLPFWGSGVQTICEALKDSMIVVEPGIGYADGSFADFRVFESHSIKNNYMTTDQIKYSGNMRWYDVVIPNYFDLDDFEYCDEKENYFLFLGRVFNGKGVNIAIDMCKRLGVTLKIAGQLGDEYKYLLTDPDEGVEYVGYAGKEERKKLMSKALGFICPSQYSEPFGGVQVEAMLSGTPVISPDWGAFAEINVHGKTGYRCNTFNDFMIAGRNLMQKKIDYKECRMWAEQFSLENVAPKYEKYFQDVLNVFAGDGWYHISMPQEGFSKELVSSRYSSDMEWLQRISPDVKVTVYNKSEKECPVESIPLPNIGFCEHSYYYHILNNYDNLSDYTFFCQDYPFDHVSDFVSIVNNFDPESDNNALLHTEGYWGLFSKYYAKEKRWNELDGYPDHGDRCLDVEYVWNELFDCDIPLTYYNRKKGIAFVPAAHPVVSKDTIRLRSKKFYEKVVRILETRKFGAYEIERLTWAIFNKDYKDKFSDVG